MDMNRKSESTRRQFCSSVVFGAVAGSLSPVFAKSETEHAADVVIIGGGLGGCAAAIAALRNGLKVIMTEAQLPGTVLRLPMVYGPGDYAQRRLLPYLKRMDDGRSAILLGKTMASWRWTKGYVENVAAAIALAVTNENAAGRIYNIGESKTRTEAAWVRAIGRAAGWSQQS